MGFDSSFQTPVIDFSEMSSNRRSEGWVDLCKKVRESLENYGFFEVVYDKISPELQAETFSVVKELFALPFETKKQNVNPKPYHGYAGQHPLAPLYESFGVEDASDSKSMRAFVELMWPSGHHLFSQTISSVVEKLEELNRLIETAILDSYDLGEKLDSIMTCNTLLRLMKYKAPPAGEYVHGLHAHTDKPLSALIFSEQVFGFEAETKDGQWIKLSPSPNSFIFTVGDPLMAWSNGRLHAVKHRVMMKGNEDRYSLAAFPVPIAGTIIKPQKELVDKEHPQILKAFDYMDFIIYSYSEEAKAIDSSRQVFEFAGN